MKMRDLLACVASLIDNEAVSRAVDAFPLRHLLSRREHAAHRRVEPGTQVCQICEMLVGDYEQVHGRFRGDVPYDEAVVVSV